MIDTVPEVPLRRPSIEPRGSLRIAAADALTTAVWFGVSGLLGALVWWQVAPLPTAVKIGDGASLEPTELIKQVGVDGWFFVIALVGGLLGGIVLMAWRRRHPVLMVLLIVLGGILAAWLVIQLGLALGPGDELAALRDAPEGTTVETQLTLGARGMFWVWPTAAAMGALVQLWVLDKPREETAGSLG